MGNQKEYNKRYREKHREQIYAYHRAWVKRNADKKREWNKNYYERKKNEKKLGEKA